MAVVIASNLRKELAGTPLFDGVSFTLERRERLALAGPNGAGKTTLLRCLTGDTELHGGELVLEKGTRIALHDQRPPRDTAVTLLEHALAGAAGREAEAELRRLEAAMAAGDHGRETLDAYARAQARLDHAGGYAWRERVESVLRGLGFSTADHDRPLSTFSGGELTRAALARAFAGDPDLLLLDEPTNHLDMASLEWLERELQTIDAAVVLVAHDRWFLEATTTAVLELEGGRSTFFPGPWHAWREEKAARAAALAKTAERQAEDLARLERFVARFRYGTKARQAQSKLKQIERIKREAIAPAARRGRTLGFEFLEPARSGRTVLEVEGLELRAGERTLVSGASFALERGEHVGLVGPNGSGKTTLLEAVLGRRPAQAGTARIGYGVELAYFSQHEADAGGTPASPPIAYAGSSVLQYAQAATGLQRPEAQALLGQFLFSGWDAHDKPVVALSGGERRRLDLAVLVASGANFLVLDEPTNHLDLESRESLERALEAFPGTVLLVSHDRALLDAVATRILSIEDGAVRSYDGGWAEFARAHAESEAPAVPPEPKPAPRRPAKPARPRRPRELERVEAEIEALEERIAELERSLAEDWTNVDTIAAHRRARDDLQALYGRWEELFEAEQAAPEPA
jgi:ATP-binding cassette subfamily F protein 3